MMENEENDDRSVSEDEMSMLPTQVPKLTLKLYKRRWLMLFIFSMNSLANACLFSTISAINDIAAAYYRVNPSIIDWLPNSFLLIYIFISLPSAYFLTSWGLRVSVIVGSTLNAIATCLHFAGWQRNGFHLVMSGQIISAISVGAILQVPPRLSTVWFGTNEHAKATSIAVFCNILGVGIGFLQPTHMVKASANMDIVGDGMFRLYLSQMIFVLVCLLLVYLFFEEKPPLPPSYAGAFTDVKSRGSNVPAFWDSIKMLVTDVNFNLLTHGYGLYFGMYCFFCVVLNEMVKAKVEESNIGWMGFSADFFGILGVIIGGYIADKYKCYRFLSMAMVFGALIAWVAFTFTLMHTNSSLGMFVAFCVVGFLGIPYFATGIEQAVEMTYPIPEGTSSAIILLVGNLYGFVFILFLGAWVDKGKLVIVCYITIGIYCLSFFFICVTRTKLKREDAEKLHKSTGINCASDDSMPTIS